MKQQTEMDCVVQNQFEVPKMAFWRTKPIYAGTRARHKGLRVAAHVPGDFAY
jgi:hypothetical protein